jgi:hypothetical protein
MPQQIQPEHFLNSLFTVLDENAIGGAMAIVAHTAYHLGEIRQALYTLK